MVSRVWQVVLVTTLKVYGDESADETKSRVFAVAVVIGSEDEWALAVPQWLSKTKGKPFHANVCESEFANDLDPQKHKDNLRLYADLTQILANSNLAGMAVALDLRCHVELFPDVPPDTAYQKCLADIIRVTGLKADAFNDDPNEPDRIRLEFTFDSRRESDGTAAILYDGLRSLWGDPEIFATKISFEGGYEPRLEMADLLARESMKEMDRKATGSTRKPRRSYQALRSSALYGGAGSFLFFEHDRAYCEKWRAIVDKPESQAMLAEYDEWLVRTGRVQNGRPHDNNANRYLFSNWWENREWLKKKHDESSS